MDHVVSGANGYFSLLVEQRDVDYFHAVRWYHMLLLYIVIPGKYAKEGKILPHRVLPDPTSPDDFHTHIRYLSFFLVARMIFDVAHTPFWRIILYQPTG